MSLAVFLAVLFAAALHATWNAIVKGGSDKMLGMSAVVIGQGIFGALALPFAPVSDWSCWPYLLAGVALHLGYQFFLMNAYRIGDLTQVYPIARGTAPLLVAAFSVVVLGVSFSPMELLAVVVIASGIMSLALVRKADGLRNRNAAVLAVTTGVFIASYSLVDGIGARIAGTSLGFYGTLAALNGLAFAGIALIWRPRLISKLPGAKRAVFIGGGASFVAYTLVVWAFMQAPIALVTALRETSIIFALLIGVFVLREPLNLAKVTSTMLTVCGAALLRLSKG